MKLVAKTSARLTGDKINLPASMLNFILAQYAVEQGGILPHPLTFEIRRGGVSSELKSYGRVVEFTADINSIEISSFIANALGIKDSDQSSNEILVVKEISLPKATLAVLTPLTENYLQIPDMRSLLTSFLRRHHAILIEGSTLNVDFGRYQNVAFQIKKLNPESACLCLDTDLEIDIAADDLEFAESAIRLKNQVENINSSVGSWKKRESEWVFDVDPQTLPAILKIPLIEENVDVYEIKAILENGSDINIFGSDVTEIPSIIDHTFYSVEKGSRTILLSAREFSRQERPFMYISLEPYQKDTTAKYRLQIIAKKSLVSDVDTEESQPNLEMEKCENCLLFVPVKTIQMHSAFCLRNNILCKKCQKVFHKSGFPSHWHCDQCFMSGNIEQMAKHIEMVHTQHTCSCGESLYLAQVKQHRTECPDRFIICRYCHLLIVAGKPSRLAKDLYLDLKLSKHESECGARTIDCLKCKKSVQLKDIQLHAKTHEIQKQQQALPFQICRNTICPNPQNSRFLNSLQLCQTCFGPFYSPRYDPSNQKIPQKIVQTYHHQLTIGCNSNYCSNPVSYYPKTDHKYLLTSTAALRVIIASVLMGP